MAPSTPEKSAHSDYRSHVEKLFDEGSSLLFQNKDKDHAAVLISTLFNKAQTEAVVLCRNLDKDFYDRPEVSASILKAANRGVNIKIRIQESPSEGKFLLDLKKLQSPNISLVTCTPARGADLPINFTIVDRKAFRLENDRNTSCAVASANKPEVAERLLEIFESLG